MAGEATYTYDQIEFILLRWVQGATPAKIAVEFSVKFWEAEVGRIRYVKNKYAREARYGTPLWNFKNIRPAWEYEKWLQENRPENFDPEKIQERKDAYFTPNGTSRIQSEGSSSSAPSTSQQSGPKPPKTPTRARGRKRGATAAARTKSLATRASNASSAAAGGLSNYMTGAAPGFGDLSSYVAGAPTSFGDTSMAGPPQSYGQLPLPELHQAAPTDLYSTAVSHSYLEQLTAPAPAATQAFPSEASMDSWGSNTGFMDSQGFAMDSFGLSNGFMENQNGDDWDLNDPKFGDDWKDYLSFDFGVPEPVNTSEPSLEGVYSGEVFGHGNPVEDSPTFYKSTLAESFEMPATVVEENVGEPLAIDPALFTSFSDWNEAPAEDSARSLMDMLNDDGAPNFIAEGDGEQQAADGGLGEG